MKKFVFGYTLSLEKNAANLLIEWLSDNPTAKIIQVVKCNDCGGLKDYTIQIEASKEQYKDLKEYINFNVFQ